MNRIVCIATVLGAGLLLPAFGQDKKPETEVIKASLAKREKCACSACTVNFTKELGLPLDFLADVGHRIHRARMAPDPVDLAMAARSLSVAEKLSGKKASVTSDAVLKEAVALGRMRAVSTELAALELIVEDDATRKELKNDVERAKKREAEAAAAVKSGESSKSFHGTLRVVNHTGECLRIYIDGFHLGVVHSGQSWDFFAVSPRNPNVFEAMCVADGDLIRREVKFGHGHFYEFHIDN